MSKNEIRDISVVVNFNHLLTLNASTNQVKSIAFLEEYAERLQFIQMMDLSSNKLKELTNIPQPRITRVNLSENEIDNCSNFQGHTSLLCLELKKNKLLTCVGLANMQLLTELYLNENEITTLKDLNNLPSLRKLDANTNKLESLDNIPSLPSL